MAHKLAFHSLCCCSLAFASDASATIETHAHQPTVEGHAYVLLQKRTVAIKQHDNISAVTAGNERVVGTDAKYVDVGQGGCYDANGNGVPIFYKEGSSPQACEDACSSESTCLGYTYVTSGQFLGECWMSTLSTVPPNGWLYYTSASMTGKTVDQGNGEDYGRCIKKTQIAGMSGDPHVWYHGKRTSIHLPTTHFTKLLEQGDVAVYGQGGPDENTTMNFLVAVSVRFRGDEVVRVDQRLGRLNHNDSLMKFTMHGETWTSPRHVVAAHGALRMNTTKANVKLLHQPSGMEIVVSSKPTTRRDSLASHHLNLHFGAGLVTLGKGAAVGALPQIWGTQPLSSGVAALIRDRREAAAPADLRAEETFDRIALVGGDDHHDAPGGGGAAVGEGEKQD